MQCAKGNRKGGRIKKGEEEELHERVVVSVKARRKEGERTIRTPVGLLVLLPVEVELLLSLGELLQTRDVSKRNYREREQRTICNASMSPLASAST